MAWTFYVMHDQLLHFNISENPISEKAVMRTTLRCKAVLATFWFPANLGLFFVELRVFLKTCGLLVFGLVLIEIFLFFGFVIADFCFKDCFFSNFMALLLFQFPANGILGVFLWKFAHFGLVFSDFPPWFFIWFSCWFFVLLNLPAYAFWACFWVKLPIWLVFQIYLIVFAK